MTTKTNLPSYSSSLGTLSGKTLTRLETYSHGSVQVIELGFSDKTTQFVKCKNGQFEIGGTNEWDTGTKK